MRGSLVIAALLVSAPPALAADPAAPSASDLGGKLTPTGAERAGNKDGTIPAWTGGYTTPIPDYAEGDPRPDPFAADKPLFAITAQNYRDYADKLPDGQKALFAKYPDYRMEIYPTRRSAAAPAEVYESIRRNATRAHAAPEGIRYGVEGAAGGIPFPIPKDGYEVVWNHLLAFWGPAREDDIRNYFMSADGTLELTNRYREIVDFPYYYPGISPADAGPYFFQRREISSAPDALAGRGYLSWQPVDIARDHLQAWQYLPRERRVRKSPTLSYDTPTPDGAGIESFDDYYVFSGSPDHYDFRLLGKREMYVPYNDNRFHTLPIAQVAKARFADPDALRYELHRVWVVDGTLVSGERDTVPHRRLYMDEDSWFAIYGDSWDADGHLWKFSQSTMYLVPDLPAIVLGSEFIYDLQGSGYLLSFTFNDEKVQFRQVAPHKKSEFSPETLAQTGER